MVVSKYNSEIHGWYRVNNYVIHHTLQVKNDPKLLSSVNPELKLILLQNSTEVAKIVIQTRKLVITETTVWSSWSICVLTFETWSR